MTETEFRHSEEILGFSRRAGSVNSLSLLNVFLGAGRAMPKFPKMHSAAALDVTWRFEQYRSYGQNRATALRAFRKRTGMDDHEECERLFDAASKLWADCRRVVKEHADWIDYDQSTNVRPFRELLPSQTRRWGSRTVDQALWMVIFWFYLK